MGNNSCIKGSLILINVLMLIVGMALIVVGSITLSHFKGFQHANEFILMNKLSIAVLAVGVVVFCVALLGCCGVITGNKCSIMIYTIKMSVLLIITVGIVEHFSIKSDEIPKDFVEMEKQAWRQHSNNSEMMDIIQLTFNCCGHNSYKDYGQFIPASCCIQEFPCNATVLRDSHKPGCLLRMTTAWQENRKRLSAMAISVIVVEIIAVVFAAVLVYSRREQMFSRSSYQTFH